MEIGKEEPLIVIEPLEDPVPGREPEPAPEEPVPMEAPEAEPVPR